MRIFAVNRHNDIYRAAHGSLALAHGADALRQNLEHVMQSLLGEMIHHTNRGLPYADCVWSGAPKLRQFEAFARVALKKERGVRRIVEFAAERRENTLLYRVTLDTIYGEMTINAQDV